MLTLNINANEQQFDVADDMSLLWVLRDVAHLTCTRLGCGMAQCGACRSTPARIAIATGGGVG
ncbi:hypothetical protein PS723_01322 [Pseudomonas fluorescens]|uniref:2Fe-2S ferredoxin-type domain-containing protein n=1 Tax=Pseudomonas fluorescens TaxID=294 RepID=A0A5E7AY09_PSEFL|nr:hypothetical protein PS723_01322 [Pseudomonas fluorescens]